MIDRRRLIATLAAGSTGKAFGVDARKVWHVGYLGVARPGVSPEGEQLLGFQACIGRQRFCRGQEHRRRTTCRRRSCRPGRGARRRVGASWRRRPGCGRPNPIRAAKDATATIPIVMLNAADPVAAGIIRSLARPGGNITGLTDFDDDLYPKRFELLKTAAPRIGRLAFVENTTLLDAAKAGALNKQYEAAARALGLGLTRIALNGTRDFERATTGRRCARPRSQRDRLPAAQGVRRVRHPTTAAHDGGESDRRQRRRLDVLRS